MKFTSWLTILLSVHLAFVSGLHAEDESPSIPSTDITVLPISFQSNLMKVDAGNALNALHHVGYDNQPHFSQDGDKLYFTRMLEEQTDIFAYHFVDQQLINITNTDEISEYSPTIYDATSLSIIGVNPEGQQHLRLVNLDDRSHQVLNPAIEPVGYHAWLNPKLAAVFVLGKVMTLQLFDVNAEEKAKALVENIGRCLQRIDHNKVSFTQLIDGRHHIFIVDEQGQVEPTDIVLPEGVEDYVWWDAKGVVVGQDSQLWYISTTDMKKIDDLKNLGIRSISRLALDPNKQKLAIVHE